MDMATNQISEVIQHFRRTVLLRDGAGLTDGQLLEDYISCRDQVALAALVRRHGPMVWGVCRRVLWNHHDAEDAFQATFLVLVRKAASIVPRGMVANWLYGVAHQTALQARRTAARRRARERQVMEMPEPAVAEQDLLRDLQPLLDEELNRLPDQYRAVVVLCDLEGKTRKEAGRQLGLPEGTVGSRLARARVMLAKRLARRGLAVPGGVLAAALSQNVASAGVPTSVVSSTIKAATLFAVGQPAGVVSVKVAALTEGVLKTMLLTKLKTATAVLLVVSALVGGAGLIYQTQAAEQQEARRASEKDNKEKQPAAKGKPKVVEYVEAVTKDLERLQGKWELTSFVVYGQTLELPKDTERRTLIIEGNKATLYIGPQEIRMTWLIDPTKKPKTLDICYEQSFSDGKAEKGAFEGKVWPAIYELEGDTLRECSDDPGGERPSDFSAPRKTKRSLMTYKRIKS
jgi:RNA polymerase sigma factor (sigma-70 family)